MRDRTGVRKIIYASVASCALLAVIVTVVLVRPGKDLQPAGNQPGGEAPSIPMTLAAPIASTTPAFSAEKTSPAVPRALTATGGLVLIGTVSGSVRESFAILKDESTDQERLFRIGQRVFERGYLVAINASSVELQSADERSTLYIHGTGAASAGEGIGTSATAVLAKPDKGQTETAIPGGSSYAALVLPGGQSQRTPGSPAVARNVRKEEAVVQERFVARQVSAGADAHRPSVRLPKDN